MQSLARGNEHHTNVCCYMHLDVYNTTRDCRVLSLLLPGWINKNYNNFFKACFQYCSGASSQKKTKRNKDLFESLFSTSLAIRTSSIICGTQ